MGGLQHALESTINKSVFLSVQSRRKNCFAEHEHDLRTRTCLRTRMWGSLPCALLVTDKHVCVRKRNLVRKTCSCPQTMFLFGSHGRISFFLYICYIEIYMDFGGVLCSLCLNSKVIGSDVGVNVCDCFLLLHSWRFHFVVFKIYRPVVFPLSRNIMVWNTYTIKPVFNNTSWWAPEGRCAGTRFLQSYI